MRLVDTSAWIEWLIGSETGSEVERHLPHIDDWLVPTIVQLELCKWLRRVRDDETAQKVIAFSMQGKIVDLDTALAMVAADISLEHRLATADGIIYATCQTRAADLLTCDAHFAGLPGVIYVRKT